MAVLLNVMFMCVGIQCYDKYVCVCVESDLLDVFSSSLIVLLFAANMATDALSLRSPLKAQAPTPTPTLTLFPCPPPPPAQILSGSQSYMTLSESWIRIGLLLPWSHCPLEVCAPYSSQEI